MCSDVNVSVRCGSWRHCMYVYISLYMPENNICPFNHLYNDCDAGPALNQHCVNILFIRYTSVYRLPANTGRRPNVASMLSHRLRHWPNVGSIMSHFIRIYIGYIHLTECNIPTIHLQQTNVVLMLGHRLQRWPNIKTTSNQFLVLIR